MSKDGRAPDGKDRGVSNAAWSAFGYLISGMVVYGGVGWLLDYWLQRTLFLPIGLIVGIVLGIYLVYVRFGRS